jgi:16S rRNA (cytidine1402-2'-O)-methyltransferase
VLFAGFLPPKSAARKTELAELKGLAATLVFYESAQRLPETLADMALVFGPRRAAVCRELTKRFEEIKRDTLDALAAHYAEAGAPRGEIVVVVEGDAGEKPIVAESDIDAALERALATHSVRDATALVALELGQPKRAVYERALMLAGKDK